MPPELQLLVILIAFIGFWAIVIRPARNAQKRTARLQESIQVGDRVIISAGIFGTVQDVEADRVALEVAPGVAVTVARQAVVRRLEDEDATGTDGSTQGATTVRDDTPDADEE